MQFMQFMQSNAPHSGTQVGHAACLILAPTFIHSPLLLVPIFFLTDSYK